ncbi:MAG: SUMF1/EgtB/PvdO family nonheme iron enzyme [Sulfuritalea sp.]|nr:SUMF1/EgtB/PvdO family nonheme iron enzyme [Sulfuritalea sp.]
MRIATWLLVGLMAAVVQMPAQAARLALVVGVDSYRNVGVLKNARADARAMAQALKGVGYTVSLHEDPGQLALRDALRVFRGSIQGGDEVVVFFSGHGVQIAGVNYLLPADVRGEDPEQVKDDGLPLWKMLHDIKQRKPVLTLAIVDACRDNPFEQKGKAFGERGLTGVSAATGQMVIFAAGEGQRALDRLSRGDTSPNGLFTRVFVKEVDKPGVPVDRMLKNVRREVAQLARSVGHEQVPAIYDQVEGEFYFRRDGTQVASLTAVATDPLALELTFWNSVKDSRDAGEIKLYLEKYPRGQFAGLARGRVKSLEAVPVAPAAAPAPAAPTAGQRIQDCAECPELVVIPSGSFSMGSNDGLGNEKPVRTVRIGNAFALGKTEVTQGQWRAMMGSNPSHFSGCGDACPVDKVSWDDAQAFVKKLSEKTGKRYRLPSEAEWEYACRAGRQQTYCGGDDVGTVAWYRDNGDKMTHAVGGKQANAFGLFDMSGNVWEWVEDCYHDSYRGAPTDGSAWTGGCKDDRRVLRSSSAGNSPLEARSANRFRLARVIRDLSNGFRVARMLP